MARRQNPRTRGAKNLRAPRILSIVQQYQGGRSIPEIARNSRVKTGTIYRVLAREGVLVRERPYNPRPFVPRALVDQTEGDQIFRLYDTMPNMSFRRVADILGRPKSTVGNYHRRNRYARRVRARSNPALTAPDAMMADGRALKWTLPEAEDRSAAGPRQGDTATYIGSRSYPLKRKNEPAPQDRFFIEPDALWANASPDVREELGIPRSQVWNDWLEDRLGDPVAAQRLGKRAIITPWELAKKEYGTRQPTRRNTENALEALSTLAADESYPVYALGKPYLEPGAVVRLTRAKRVTPKDSPAYDEATALVYQRRDGSSMAFYLADVALEGPDGGRPEIFRIWIEANLLDHPLIDPGQAQVLLDAVKADEGAAAAAEEAYAREIARESAALGGFISPIAAPPDPVMAKGEGRSDFDVVAGIGEGEVGQVAIKQSLEQSIADTERVPDDQTVVMVVFGGRKGFPAGFNPSILADFIATEGPDLVVTGGGAGVEQFALDTAKALGILDRKLPQKASSARNKKEVERINKLIAGSGGRAIGVNAGGPGSKDFAKRLEAAGHAVIPIESLASQVVEVPAARPELPMAAEEVAFDLPGGPQYADESTESFFDVGEVDTGRGPPEDWLSRDAEADAAIEAAIEAEIGRGATAFVSAAPSPKAPKAKAPKAKAPKAKAPKAKVPKPKTPKPKTPRAEAPKAKMPKARKIELVREQIEAANLAAGGDVADVAAKAVAVTDVTDEGPLDSNDLLSMGYFFDEGEDEDTLFGMTPAQVGIPTITEYDVMEYLSEAGAPPARYLEIRPGVEGTIDVLLSPADERAAKDMIEGAFNQIEAFHRFAQEALMEGRDDDAVNYYVSAFGYLTGLLWSLRVLFIMGDEQYVRAVAAPLAGLLQDNIALAVQLSNRDIIPLRGFFQPTLP